MKSGVLFLYFFCFVLLLLTQQTPSLAANQEELLFQQGNAAYSRGDYQQAIDIYEKIEKTKGLLSASLLYNLGNSYAKSGRVGLAILNYERAFRLDSTDSDIAGNLDLTRKENGLYPGEARGMEHLFHILSLDQWALIVLVCLILVAVTLCLDLRFPLQIKYKKSLCGFFALVALIAMTGCVITYRHYSPAVVINTGCRLLISPFDSAAPVGAIPESRLLYPQKTYKDFVFVKDETGREGWIAKEDIGLVIEK
jgi:tetratricopeptide (TPR) repeat protein